MTPAADRTHKCTPNAESFHRDAAISLGVIDIRMFGAKADAFRMWVDCETAVIIPLGDLRGRLNPFLIDCIHPSP
jgi:hypothetical protein